jgi:hypothetical protein
MINVYNILVRKHDGKWPFGRPRRRWENLIKLDIIVIRRENMD